MLAKVFSSAVKGIDAHSVEIEVDISNGLPACIIVGLPDASVKESKDRIKAAIKNTGLKFTDRRITVNLAPADIPKEGPSYDLPIALGILAANDQLGHDISNKYLFMGELSLEGKVRKVKGVLPIALYAKEKGYEGVIVPYENAKEASVVSDLKTYPVKSLSETIQLIKSDFDVPSYSIDPEDTIKVFSQYDVDMSDVKGQEHAKRALEISAAGGHNIIMIGPPGSGKTMLAKRVPTILPEMTIDESMETTKIHSICGFLPEETSLIKIRPFFAPHHTISDIGLIGGGSRPKPGDVSLAHNGVLFLDELPEFKRSTLEVLRQPLENHCVTISRAHSKETYPARFMLIAAMNPCPCGYFTDAKKECHCTPMQIQKYMSKISGPLLDRIDIHLNIPAVKYEDMISSEETESSEDIRERVNRTRKIQQERFKSNKIYANSQMSTRLVKKCCVLESQAQTLLKHAIIELGISARAYDRILKVSRTIADLVQSENILEEHVGEAIQYRSLDRNLWM